MLDANRHRDRHIEKITRFEVPGNIDRQLLVPDGVVGEGDKFFARRYYFLASLFFMAPLYQRWFNRSSGQANFCCKVRRVGVGGERQAKRAESKDILTIAMLIAEEDLPPRCRSPRH